ncbi:MAG: hypothetical protein IJH37_08745 [Clostridia bacterium]|nr:hypothetical protein [Clostridia bacterium]
MQVKKHAYLIIAHSEFEILKRLLKILDDKAADMYIHIDKKTKNFDKDVIISDISSSNVYFIKRRNIEWGGDSQIKCELDLLEAASERKYEYYHLLSGVDMPLKTPAEINRFFSEEPDKIYLHFTENDPNIQGAIEQRIRYYDLFQQKIGRGAGSRAAVYEQLNTYILKIQKLLKIDRMKSYDGVFYKGSNWFSIPHNFAMYVLSQRKMIKKYFYHSSCADEIFMQTLAMNSDFKSKVIRSDIHYSDWVRGTPYVFKNEDYDEVINLDAVFARKFCAETDPVIIERLYNALKAKKES